MCQPDQGLADQDDVRRAFEAMEKLPARQKEVLYLRACEDLSAAEISAVLGISSDAVKANLCEARKKLRIELKDLFEDLFPTT